MRILITGATGLIGSHLVPALLNTGHELWLWARSPAKARSMWPELPAFARLEELPSADSFDAIINLAGEPIAATRWTQARKHTLRTSRIDLTRTLCCWLASAPRPGRLLLSGSAVGIYGNTNATPSNEQAATDSPDFASQLCRDWEAAALSEPGAADRIVLLRTGLVLSRAGGLLTQMQLPFRLGLGGRLGSGRQYMPWIHQHDYVRAIVFLLQEKDLCGPVNLCAPNPVTNSEFTRSLASQLKRPCLLPAPAWALKLALGELSELLLSGQRCQPSALEAKGFAFEFATLTAALTDLL